MFGKNEVASPDQRADGSLNIHSIFYTMQGEGPDAGTPAVFMRLARCNLRCYFCDTDFAHGERMAPHLAASTILGIADPHCRLLVITGGEPFLQNLLPLIDLVNAAGWRVSVETAGTVWIAGAEKYFPGTRGMPQNQIICSPKTPKLNPVLSQHVSAFKYVVREGEISSEDGLPIMSTQLEGQEAPAYRPTLIQYSTVPIYLQPMDEGDPVTNKRNAIAAAAACMRHGFKLSMQLHKMVDLP